MPGEESPAGLRIAPGGNDQPGTVLPQHFRFLKVDPVLGTVAFALLRIVFELHRGILFIPSMSVRRKRFPESSKLNLGRPRRGYSIRERKVIPGWYIVNLVHSEPGTQ